MKTDHMAAEEAFEVTVETWEDCEKKIKLIEKCYEDQPFFRGHSDSTWELLSTLDRRSQDMSISNYYRLVQRINPEIEAFTGKGLDLPPWNKGILSLLVNADPKNLGELLKSGYSCMAHLRHHGFPSPLLDWTASPYVAAYFAFARPIKPDHHVAIYVYVERPYNFKSIDIVPETPQIFPLGPIVRTHSRHFKQQSRYTVSAEFRDQSGWTFVPLQTVFKLPTRRQQDFLWKISVPASERVKVLSMLDRYNLNAYSLFGSEESLMETLALRHLDKS